MIEINLLPEELRKKKKRIEIPKIEFMPIVVGIVILILSIQLILILTLAVKRYSLRRLGAKWALIEPKERKFLNLNKQINSLDNKMKDIESIKKNRILWARKLNDLSDSMIPGIWLTRLFVEEKAERKYLSIKGGVSSFGRDEAAMIGRFMKILKENKTFFRDFSEIELGTIQQKIRRDVEVMDFTINCYFKD